MAATLKYRHSDLIFGVHVLGLKVNICTYDMRLYIRQYYGQDACDPFYNNFVFAHQILVLVAITGRQAMKKKRNSKSQKNLSKQ